MVEEEEDEVVEMMGTSIRSHHLQEQIRQLLLPMAVMVKMLVGICWSNGADDHGIALTLAEEARNTAGHNWGNSDAKLRFSHVKFVRNIMHSPQAARD